MQRPTKEKAVADMKPPTDAPAGYSQVANTLSYGVSDSNYRPRVQTTLSTHTSRVF